MIDLNMTPAGRQCCKEYLVRGEVLPIRARERALAFRCAAEPGISPMRGRDQRTKGGGMNIGQCFSADILSNRCCAKRAAGVSVKRATTWPSTSRADCHCFCS